MINYIEILKINVVDVVVRKYNLIILWLNFIIVFLINFYWYVVLKVLFNVNILLFLLLIFCYVVGVICKLIKMIDIFLNGWILMVYVFIK